MVLAAGRGERMRPLSDVVAKPALPLPEGPVIGSALRLAAAAGCRRVTVNVWHLAETMERAARAAVPDALELLVSRERELMDTAGGLALARARGLLAGRGPVLVVNGDCLLDLELEPMMARHADAGDLVTLALLPHPDPRRWSRVHLGDDGEVERIEPPGAARSGDEPLLYPGVMLVDRGLLEELPVARAGVADTLWRPAMAARRLGGIRVRGSWREAGTPADYLAAVLARLGSGSSVAPGATVAADARLDRALVGEAATVGAGAVVRRSVVAAGARVEEGARVEDSVLLGAVAVAPGERVARRWLAAPVRD